MIPQIIAKSCYPTRRRTHDSNFFTLQKITCTSTLPRPQAPPPPPTTTHRHRQTQLHHRNTQKHHNGSQQENPQVRPGQARHLVPRLTPQKEPAQASHRRAQKRQVRRSRARNVLFTATPPIPPARLTNYTISPVRKLHRRSSSNSTRPSARHTRS